ncbi:MAG: DUF262 domain-containing protein [Kineosporiaceae bacterium]|nr:DUF262 domain-containing protein [Aeromicrobium sp.]
MRPTNVVAMGINTLEWLSEEDTIFAVPVYQRQYRWDTGSCRQLLEDIRAIAVADEQQTHVIGSVLASASICDGDPTELALIDGQQRVSTLMLLIASIWRTACSSSTPPKTSNFPRLLHAAEPVSLSACHRVSPFARRGT